MQTFWGTQAEPLPLKYATGAGPGLIPTSYSDFTMELYKTSNIIQTAIGSAITLYRSVTGSNKTESETIDMCYKQHRPTLMYFLQDVPNFVCIYFATKYMLIIIHYTLCICYNCNIAAISAQFFKRLGKIRMKLIS